MECLDSNHVRVHDVKAAIWNPFSTAVIGTICHFTSCAKFFLGQLGPSLEILTFAVLIVESMITTLELASFVKVLLQDVLRLEVFHELRPLDSESWL